MTMNARGAIARSTKGSLRVARSGRSGCCPGQVRIARSSRAPSDNDAALGEEGSNGASLDASSLDANGPDASTMSSPYSTGDSGWFARLVPRTRSSRTPCRRLDRELRVQRGTRIIELLVGPLIPKFVPSVPQVLTNFGIGPLA